MLESYADPRKKKVRIFFVQLAILLSYFRIVSSYDNLNLGTRLSERTDDSHPEWLVDNNIVHQIYCHAPDPPNILDVSSWPVDIRRNWYHDLTSLCAYNSLSDLSLACICAAPFISDKVFCYPPPLSLSEFYHSRLRNDCETSCKCAVAPVILKDPEDIREYHWRKPLRGWKPRISGTGKQRLGNYNGRYTALYTAETRGSGQLSDSFGDELKTTIESTSPDISQGTSNDEMETELPKRPSRYSSVSSPSCHAPCSSMTDCGGAIFGCVCIVDDLLDQTFDGGSRFTSSSCGYMRKRKRSMRQLQDSELEQICACNKTYVSIGCCGAVDGIVEEDVSLNRGILNFKDY